MSVIETTAFNATPDSHPGEPTWEIALLFPSQGQWTEEEYLALDTNRLVELSDGCLEVLPMAKIWHQLIVQFLYKQLDAFVAARACGLVFTAPLPVRLWPGKFRGPDVIYLRPDRTATFYGQPEGADLVMEVVSEGEKNRDRDLRVKRQEYARAGISEYWIVDRERQTIEVLALDGAEYRVHGEFGPGSIAASILLPGFSVAADEVFAMAESVE